MDLNFNDFEKQDIKFDIDKLKEAYHEILKIKGFEGVAGVSNFGAISLTQIPGIQTLSKDIKLVVFFGPNQTVLARK